MGFNSGFKGLSFRAPSMAVGGVLTMSSKCLEILQIIYDRNLIHVFQNWKTCLKIYKKLAITGWEDVRFFYALRNKNQISIDHARGKTELFFCSNIQSGQKKCIHSLLINIFGISYASVWMPMVATSNTYTESKIQGHFSCQFCFCINTLVTIIE